MFGIYRHGFQSDAIIIVFGRLCDATTTYVPLPANAFFAARTKGRVTVTGRPRHVVFWRKTGEPFWYNNNNNRILSRVYAATYVRQEIPRRENNACPHEAAAVRLASCLGRARNPYRRRRSVACAEAVTADTSLRRIPAERAAVKQWRPDRSGDTTGTITTVWWYYYYVLRRR